MKNAEFQSAFIIRYSMFIIDDSATLTDSFSQTVTSKESHYMYLYTLTVHSIVRWIVLIAAVTVVIRAYSGWLGGRTWSSFDSRIGMIFTTSIDIQFLLGISLYLFMSPMTKAAFQNFSAAMSNDILRYWVIEHILLMLLAVILAHIGRERTKKAIHHLKKFKNAALYYSGSLVLIIVGIPWPFFSYGRPLL